MEDRYRGRYIPNEGPVEQNEVLMFRAGKNEGGMPLYSGVSMEGGFRSEMTPSGLDVPFLLRLSLRHWRILISIGFLGVLSGVLYLHFAQRIYKAEAEFQMNVRRPKIINTEAVFEDTGSGRDSDVIFNTRFAKFKSPAMEQLATKEFFKRFPAASSPDYPAGLDSDTLPKMIRDAEWSKVPDANIVRVSYESPYPRFAASLVNVLSDCAGELMTQENQAMSDAAVKWLVSQSDDKRKELETVEGRLTQVRKDAQIDSLEQRKSALAVSLASAIKEREDLISKLSEKKTLQQFVAGLHDVDQNLESLPTGLPKQNELNDLVRQWRAAHEEFQQAAGRYTEVHPAYRLAKDKVDRARQRLDQFIEFSAKGVQSEVELLEKQGDHLNQRIDAMKDESLDLDQKLAVGEQRVQQLERQRDAADTSYQTMLRRIEEARLAADDNMASTMIIRNATIPDQPVKPRPILLLVFSVVLSGMGGIAVVGFVELGLDRVGAVNDLRAMHLKILGAIPTQQKSDVRGELATIGLRDKFSPVVEIFAGINGLLASGRYRDHAQVLLLSSVMPGEGKTVATCNMAVSSAMNGMRTLLIDGDLRRPQLKNVFSISEEHPSLLEWLVDGGKGLKYEDLVSKDIIKNLDVISSRPLTDANPAELLGRGHIAELLDWARNHYERVIIDSPPLGPVGDAQVLANNSDAVIMVSRIGKARRRALKFALARFADIDIPVLGCIANDVPYSLAGMFIGAEGYGYGSYKPYGRD